MSASAVPPGEPAVAGSQTRGRGLRTVSRGVLLDIAPPLVAYYGLRAAGAAEFTALLAATVLSGAKVLYDVVQARRLDPFAGYLLLTFGLSLAVALATTDARLILAGNTLVNGIGGVIFLVSGFIGKPLSEIVVERASPGTAVRERQRDGGYRLLHKQISALWGVGLILEVGLRLIVIFSYSVDVANGVASLVSLGTLALLLVATVGLIRRARAQRV